MANRTARRNARIGRIPLYSVHGNILTHISQGEARQLHRDRTVRLRVRGHGANQQILAAQLTAPVREEHHSDTAISFSEMLGNAGLSDSAGYDEMCRGKVAAYPFEGDDRAPRAWCGERQLCTPTTAEIEAAS